MNHIIDGVERAKLGCGRYAMAMRIRSLLGVVALAWTFSACGASTDVQFGGSSTSSGTSTSGSANVSTVGSGGASSTTTGGSNTGGAGGSNTGGAGGESSTGSAGGVAPAGAGGSTTGAGGVGPATGSGGQGPVYPPGTLGGVCDNQTICTKGSCCVAKECAGTCMIPCFGGPNSCPAGTGCAHGYCLFDCNNDDADCLQPGFTCQHGGNYCEGD